MVRPAFVLSPFFILDFSVFTLRFWVICVLYYFFFLTQPLESKTITTFLYCGLQAGRLRVTRRAGGLRKQARCQKAALEGRSRGCAWAMHASRKWEGVSPFRCSGQIHLIRPHTIARNSSTDFVYIL